MYNISGRRWLQSVHNNNNNDNNDNFIMAASSLGRVVVSVYVYAFDIYKCSVARKQYIIYRSSGFPQSLRHYNV